VRHVFVVFHIPQGVSEMEHDQASLDLSDDAPGEADGGVGAAKDTGRTSTRTQGRSPPPPPPPPLTQPVLCTT